MNIQSNLNSDLIFIKFGGSLITQKGSPRTPRLDVLSRLAVELKDIKENKKGIKILLGHGSGSFAHIPAKKYGTRDGVRSRKGWDGFAKVWLEARILNQLVVETLHDVGLPAVSFPVSSGAITLNGKIEDWETSPIHSAIESNILPVVYGDVVFDKILGGTILSTEDIFTHLAQVLLPSRILLAGLDQGVWVDYPACTKLISNIPPNEWRQVIGKIEGSSETDVTGGMLSKVESMVYLCTKLPGLEVKIFSGDQPGNLKSALSGDEIGTIIRA